MEEGSKEKKEIDRDIERVCLKLFPTKPLG